MTAAASLALALPTALMTSPTDYKTTGSSAARADSKTSIALEILSPCAAVGCDKVGQFDRCPCRTVTYCGTACQKKHWKTHKVYHKNKHFVAPPKAAGPIPVIFDDQKTRHQMTQDEFLRRTGVLYSPKAVWKEDSKVQPSKDEPESFLEDALKALPPRLVLRESEHLGLGLFADEFIDKERVIAFMGGEIVPARSETLRNRLYSAGTGNDQMKYGSLGVFANDGPPNCTILMGPNKQPLLFSNHPIAKGEEILCNYGPVHFVKAGPYYISPASYQRIVSFLRSPTADLKFFHLDDEKKVILHANPMRDYIFSTLPVLMRLLLENHLSVAHAMAVLAQLRTMKKMDLEDPELLDFESFFLKVTNGDFKIYEGIILLVSKIQDNDPVKKKLIQLSQTLTALNCADLFVRLNELSVINLECIDEQSQMYQLIEKLQLLLHGTLRGSYLGTDDPFPDVQVDLIQWQADFKRLNNNSQEILRRKLTECLEKSNELQKPKFLALQKLIDERVLSNERKGDDIKKTVDPREAPTYKLQHETGSALVSDQSPQVVLTSKPRVTPINVKPHKPQNGYMTSIPFIASLIVLAVIAKLIFDIQNKSSLK